MADEELNPTVTLNANVDPYVQGMNEATVATERTSGAVTGLLQQTQALYDKTSKGLTLVGAGTLASLTALALVADRANQQMDTLAATSKITGGNLGYLEKSISSMASGSPKSRAEITALTTSLSKLGLSSEKQVTEFTKLFSKMGAATGESSQGLAEQMVQLNRTMGNLNTDSVKKFSNSVTSLSANLGVSATGALQFSNAIAPFTRAAGIGEAATIGLGAAFSKAGADGMAAANTFSQMTSEITNSIQDGSPVLNKYASAVGMTMEQFKDVDPAERFAKIVDAISAAGPNAGRLLTNLGFDGVRAARALQQVASESGGLRKAMGLAETGKNSNAIEEGAGAADNNLTDQLAKIKNSSQNVAVSLGNQLVGPLTGVAKAFAGMAAFGSQVSDVFAPLVKIISGLGLAFVALGIAMKMAGAAAAINAIAFAARSALGSGVQSGYRAGKAGGLGAFGQGGGAGTARGGEYAGRYAAGQLTPFESKAVRFGERIGGLVSPTQGPGGVMGTAASGVLRGFGAWERFMGGFYKDSATAGYNRNAFMSDRPGDPAKEQKGPPSRSLGSNIGAVGRAFTSDPRAFVQGFTAKQDTSAIRANDAKYATDRAKILASDTFKTEEARNKELRKLDERANVSSRQLADSMIKDATKNLDPLKKPVNEAGAALRAVGGAWGTNMLSAGKNLATAANAARGALVGAMGGPIGIGITAAIVGATAAFGATKRNKAQSDQLAKEESNASVLKPYYEAAGTPEATQRSLKDVLASQGNKSLQKNKTFGEATTVSADESTFALNYGRSLTNKKLAKMSEAQLESFLRVNNSQFENNPNLLAQVALDIVTVSKDAQKAQKVLTNYAQNKTATQKDYDEMSKMYKTEINNAGFFKRNFGFGNAQGLTSMMSSDINNIETESGNLQLALGGKVGKAVRADRLRKTINALPTSSFETGAGTVYGPGESTTYAGFGSTGGFVGAGNLVTGQVSKNRTANTAYSAFFKKLEEEYAGGEKLGLSKTGLERFATDKYGNKEAAAMMNDPERRQKVVAGYLTDKGGTAAQVSTDLFGEYANMSSADLQKQINKAISAGPQMEDPVLKSRISKGREVGGAAGAELATNLATNSDSIIALTDKVGDADAQYKASSSLAKTAMSGTSNNTDALVAMTAQLKLVQGTAAESQYQGALSLVNQNRQLDMSNMTRSDRYAAGLTRLEAAQTTNPSDLSGAEAEITANKVDAAGWAKGLIRQMQEFNVSMENADRDHNKQVTRIKESAQRQELISLRNFNRQKDLQEKQFQLGITRQIEDMSKTIYNPYQRIQASSTTGSTNVIQNVQEQTQTINDQTANLKKVSKMGLSNEVISQLGLADPANAQQLARMVEELAANPQLVAAFNDALKARVKATGDLLESGFVDNYNRTVDDFKRATKEAQFQFDQAIEDSREQLRISLTQFESDYTTSITDAKDALVRANTEIAGTLPQLFTKAIAATTKALGPLATEINKAIQAILDGHPELFDPNYVTPKSRKANTEAAAASGAMSGDGSVIPPAPTDQTRNERRDGNNQAGNISGDGSMIPPTVPIQTYGFKNPPSPEWIKDNSMSAWSPNRPPTGETRATGKWAQLPGTGLGTNWIWFDYDGDPKRFDQKDTQGKLLRDPIQRAYGGQVDAGRSYVVGEKGPELLQGVSGHIMPSSSFQSSVARETVQMMRVAGFDNQTTYKGGGTTNVDNSTKIMGGQFTVVTSDPDEMGRQLKGKERLDRLRKPKP